MSLGQIGKGHTRYADCEKGLRRTAALVRWLEGPYETAMSVY
jgi:hypothetical protein